MKRAPLPTSGRKDYDQLVRFKQPRPGAAYFLLWDHDRVGAETMAFYARRIWEEGADPAMVESALQLTDQFEEVPVTGRKLVDADHLTVAERKHYAFQLQRRAWRSVGDREDPRTLLAEIRAARTFGNLVAPVLEALVALLPKTALALRSEATAILNSIGRAKPSDEARKLQAAADIIAELVALRRLEAQGAGDTDTAQRRRALVWARADGFLQEVI